MPANTQRLARRGFKKLHKLKGRKLTRLINTLTIDLAIPHGLSGASLRLIFLAAAPRCNIKLSSLSSEEGEQQQQQQQGYSLFQELANSGDSEKAVATKIMLALCNACLRVGPPGPLDSSGFPSTLESLERELRRSLKIAFGETFALNILEPKERTMNTEEFNRLRSNSVELLLGETPEVFARPAFLLRKGDTEEHNGVVYEVTSFVTSTIGSSSLEYAILHQTEASINASERENK